MTVTDKQGGLVYLRQVNHSTHGHLNANFKLHQDFYTSGWYFFYFLFALVACTSLEEERKKNNVLL